MIADTDVNREKQKKKSLQHQLGKLASQTVSSLPDFKPKGTRYESVNYGIIATIDPHSQKEHTEAYKIPKFGFNRANFD